MIVLGIILLLVAYLLPDWLPVPYPLEHLCSVVGTLLIVVGIILFVLSVLGRPVGPGLGRPVGGRRYWW